MASLYELTGEFLELQELLEDMEEVEAEDTVMRLSGIMNAIESKFDGYIKVMKNLETLQLQIDEEVKRLVERKKKLQKDIMKMKESLLLTMRATDKPKIKTALFSASVCKGKESVVIDEESDIPEEFWVEQPKVLNKTALTNYVKTHDKVDFAHLERKPYILIK